MNLWNCWFFCPGGFPNFCIRKTNLVFSLCPGTIHFHVCFNWKMSKNTKMPPIGVTQDDLVAVVISGKMKNQPMKGENLTIWGKIDTILSLLCVGSCIFVVPCYFHSKKLQLMSIKIREKRKKNWSYELILHLPFKVVVLPFFLQKNASFSVEKLPPGSIYQRTSFWGGVFQRRFGSCTEDLRRFTGSGGLLSPGQARLKYRGAR